MLSSRTELPGSRRTKPLWIDEAPSAGTASRPALSGPRAFEIDVVSSSLRNPIAVDLIVIGGDSDELARGTVVRVVFPDEVRTVLASAPWGAETIVGTLEAIAYEHVRHRLAAGEPIAALGGRSTGRAIGLVLVPMSLQVFRQLYRQRGSAAAS